MKLGAMSSMEINTQALVALGKADFALAQNLFKNNVRLHPGMQTFNNLGIYYIENGITLKNGKIMGAKYLGKKYLQKALSFSFSPILFNNLAQVFFLEKNLAVADFYWKKAYGIQGRKEYQYNRAVARYKNGDYIDCVHLLQPIMDFNEEAKQLYFFSTLQIDKQRACQILHTAHPFQDKVEWLKALYFCDMYAEIIDIATDVIDKWCLNENEWAIMIDSFLKCGRKEQVCKIISSSAGGWSPSFLKKVLQLINNHNLCEKYTKCCKFVPCNISLCGYFGCVEHENPW